MVESKRFLIGAAFKTKTLSSYVSYFSRFSEWCVRFGRSAETVEELDDAFADWLHVLFEEFNGRGRGGAEKAYAALVLAIPQAKGKLFMSSLALRGWRKGRPSQHWPPITWEVSCSIAIRMIRLTDDFRYAVAALLSFDCLLRVGELLAIRRKDVGDVGDPRVGGAARKMAISLVSTKTGPNKGVEVENSQVVALVRALLSSLPSGESRLFPFSYLQFYSKFKRACRDLCLPAVLVVHSLRVGGATHFHQLGWTVQDVATRGRWASIKTAQQYIQSARSLLLANDVPVQVAAQGSLFASDLHLAITTAISMSKH
jgi:integrase